MRYLSTYKLFESKIGKSANFKNILQDIRDICMYDQDDFIVHVNSESFWVGGNQSNKFSPSNRLDPNAKKISSIKITMSKSKFGWDESHNPKIKFNADETKEVVNRIIGYLGDKLLPGVNTNVIAIFNTSGIPSGNRETFDLKDFMGIDWLTGVIKMEFNLNIKDDITNQYQ